MADGYNVIVKINLPPEENYHSGHSVIVQGDTPEEVAKHLEGLVPGAKPGVGYTILKRFAEYALLQAVKQELKAEAVPATPAAAPAAAPQAAASADDKPATKALLKLVAKKTGKSEDELGELTTTQAKALLKGEK